MDAELLSETFVELTDTMVAGFDVIDFLHVLTDRSVQLLDVSAAGLLLADPRGELRVVAASSETARLLELFQLQNDQGPCLDCFRTGAPVAAADLATAAARWPQFAPAARQAGFAAVQALPMRLREQVIGALNLFRADPGTLAPAGVRVGQALADVATISLLHERGMRHSDILNEQLQAALNSRVIIEQAKGKLAERLGVDMDQAFTLLRDRARTLFGPAVTAQYGAALLWLALISILLQGFCNLTMMRYTVYSGEPIIVGGLRTWPGPGSGWRAVPSSISPRSGPTTPRTPPCRWPPSSWATCRKPTADQCARQGARLHDLPAGVRAARSSAEPSTACSRRS